MLRKAPQKPVTDAMRRTLSLIASYGPAERKWRSHITHDYSWHAGGRTDPATSRNVMTLYGAGYLEPHNGERDLLKVSAQGFRALGVRPLDQKRAA